MIIMFLSAILTLFCGQLFFLNYSIQGLNRAIISTPIEMMTIGVRYGEDGVFLNKTAFENAVKDYYDSQLYRYAKSYDLSFYYYNASDGSMCLTNDCSAVEITVDCKLMSTYDYHRVMYYELGRS